MAKNASAAAEGLCTWVRAMKFYHEASKIVKPKLEALAVAEGQMDAANKVMDRLLSSIGPSPLFSHAEACSCAGRRGGTGKQRYSNLLARCFVP